MPNLASLSNRELDRLVAEKVMGWNLNDYTIEGVERNLWSPTSDPAAMLQLIERMKDRGSSVLINWGEDNDLWEVSWITGGKRYSGYDQSLSRALALASGQAVGG